jgi:uncharacterized membrane protein YraQ (UPF0718 family)
MSRIGVFASAGLVRQIRQIDKVVMAFVVLFMAIAAVMPAQAVRSAGFIGAAFVNILPFILLSVAVSATVSAAGLNGQIARVFNSHVGKAIVVAALVGALSPFCSCGVIPIIAGLLVAGVPVAPVMAFWISSPLMNPQAFILTAAVLNFDFALGRVISAVALGLVAGFLTHVLVRRGLFPSPLKPGVSACGACGASTAVTDGTVRWSFLRDPDRRRIFLDESKATGWFLFKWLTLAFLIESLMVAVLPAESIGGWLGGEAWWSVPVSVAAGVPAYLNGYAAIPMVGRLVEMGMAPGAALAFLTAGAVTSIPAAMGVFALVRARLFGWYIVLGVTGSLAAGYGWQAWATHI